MPRRRALILGGTGALGGATALRLAEHGWLVEVTGRSAERMPQALRQARVAFHAVDRCASHALAPVLGDGVDLLVDLVAYSAAHVRAALPAYADSGSVVVVSSRAVYVDDAGRHINGDDAPRFPVPLRETNPTVAPAPAGADPFSREGYAPGKAAVEREALNSGLPVSVVRPSKVHGPWARNARTRPIVERMLAGADAIELARNGTSVDHLTAAANAAALIELLADAPGAGVLNIADPDPLTTREIVETIATTVGWHGRIVGLAEDEPGGETPWNAPHPIVLDMTRAGRLGYRPVAPGRELLAAEVSWVREQLTA